MKILLLLHTLLVLCCLGCSESFLEEKPDAGIVNPKTLADCRDLLENDGQLAQGLNNWFPALAALASDEYYFDKSTWQSLTSVQERNAYVWADDIYEGNPQIGEWNNCYYAIYVSNVVLDVLKNIEITTSNKSEYNDIKGTALFFRAVWNFALAETFCMPFDKMTARNELGIPLRYSPNIDQLEQRSSLEDTYNAILEDLSQSVRLLQNKIPSSYKNRPCVAAGYSMLARINLVMGNFEMAGKYADSSWQLYNKLLDYNKLNLEGDAVFDRNNVEILLMSQIAAYASISTPRYAPNTFVDSTLIDLYDPNDLRLRAYFTFTKDGRANRKNLYLTGLNITNLFNGVATDETLLILSECKAREGNLDAAKSLLEKLYTYRFAPSDRPKITFKDREDALGQILDERRKELLFRGVRWSDVRRLNVEGRNIILKRKLADEEYILPPNSLKYAFLLPLQEVQLSGLTQNKR